MTKATIFNVAIDDLAPAEVMQRIEARIKQNTSGYIATVNSEFLLMSLTNASFKSALDQADLRLCDGVGVQWAAAFLRQPRSRLTHLLLWPFSLVRLLIQPSSARRVIKHRLTGRQLFEDLLGYCAKNNHSVYFLGGGAGVAALVAEEAVKHYPQLIVSGHHEGRPEDSAEIIQHLAPSNVLFVAYGPPRQEIFIQQNLAQLQTNIAIGIGGTFDYFASTKPLGSNFRQIKPPTWVGRWGVESFWRILTQPNRFGRVWKSVVVFSAKVAAYSKEK